MAIKIRLVPKENRPPQPAAPAALLFQKPAPGEPAATPASPEAGAPVGPAAAPGPTTVPVAPGPAVAAGSPVGSVKSAMLFARAAAAPAPAVGVVPAVPAVPAAPAMPVATPAPVVTGGSLFTRPPMPVGAGTAASGTRSPVARPVSAAPFASASGAAQSAAAAGSTPPLPPAGGAAVPAGAAVPEASEALLTSSASPAVIRAMGMGMKWGLILAVVLGVGYLAIRFVVPILQELQAAEKGAPPVAVDKKASFAVQAIQQTRQVVAKNDGKVDYLNEVIGVDEKKPVPKAAPAPAPVPAEAPAAPAVPRTPGDLTPFTEALAAMAINGVFEGEDARAYIDGRLVKVGDIVHRPLGLRLVGIDAPRNELIFTNADGVTFRRTY